MKLSKNLYNLPRPLGGEPPLIPFWFFISYNEEVTIMIDWFFDELPYWISEIEYWIWMLAIAFIKYFIEGSYEIWKVIRAGIKLLLKDN